MPQIGQQCSPFRTTSVDKGRIDPGLRLCCLTGLRRQSCPPREDHCRGKPSGPSARKAARIQRANEIGVLLEKSAVQGEGQNQRGGSRNHDYPKEYNRSTESPLCIFFKHGRLCDTLTVITVVTPDDCNHARALADGAVIIRHLLSATHVTII
jgi:hypothetical protein